MKKSDISLTLILLSAFSFIFLNSCKPDEYEPYKTFVDGYIMDAVTGDSIPGALVELLEDDRGGSTLLRHYDRMLATTYTNSDGYYRIEFLCDPLKTKAILAKKENYYFSPDISMSMFSCGRQGIDFKITPLSWIRINIKNISPVDDNDSIYFFPNVFLIGKDVDTTFYREIQSSSTQVDIWDVTKNGITSRSGSFLNCSPFDTCNLNVHY